MSATTDVSEERVETEVDRFISMMTVNGDSTKRLEETKKLREAEPEFCAKVHARVLAWTLAEMHMMAWLGPNVQFPQGDRDTKLDWLISGPFSRVTLPVRVGIESALLREDPVSYANYLTKVQPKPGEVR